MQRGARQEQSSCAGVFFDFPHEDGVHVFQTVTFVHDDLAPVVSCEMLTIFDDHFISCDNHGEGGFLSGQVFFVIVFVLNDDDLIVRVMLFRDPPLFRLRRAFFLRQSFTFSWHFHGSAPEFGTVFR